MKRTSLLSLLAVLLLTTAPAAFAQNSAKLVQFDDAPGDGGMPTHDFGKIKEADGKANHSFKFKNVSGGPVKLTYVKASCGCTATESTKGAVKPGEMGTVDAAFDPKNKGDKDFNKTITVKIAKADANGNVLDSVNVQTELLRIKGFVIARQKDFTDFYPKEMGSFRLTSNHFNFPKVTPKDKLTKDFTIYNQGDKPVLIQEVKGTDYVTIDFASKTVNPKDSVKATLHYDGSKVNDWDFVSGNITLITNDEKEAEKKLFVSATVLPYVDTTANKGAKATIKFEKEAHDFGDIKDNEKQETVFSFTNVGTKPLEILKTKATCGCTTTQPDKNLLQPGETSSIKVTFNPAGKSGKQTKQVTVITNDPEHPAVKLSISSNIQKVETPGAPATPVTPGK